MSPIPSSTLYSFCFLPSILHRVECLLLAAKLNSIQLDHCMQNVQVHATKVLEAITTKKCQEEFSLESLETLGDSFLKYATSQHLFKSYEHHHQGRLTALRENLISNPSLCRMGCARNLTGFIRTEQFDPKMWIIPGDMFCFAGDYGSNIYNRGKRHIKCKVIADLVEALIGVYLRYAGELEAFRFLNWLGMKIDIHKEMFVERPLLEIPQKFIHVKALENLLKYKFEDSSLLVEALTHGSYQVSGAPGCYQRLEFLGDAVLDYLITAHLYSKHPGITPGLITNLRSASVNNACYAHVAAKAGLNKHILQLSPELHRKMSFYRNNFSQSFSGPSYGWDAGVALPKVLADVIESISAAIYIDSKFNKEKVWECIRPLMEPMVTPETLKLNPVYELNYLCAKNLYKASFKKSCEDGEASLTVEVEANGVIYSAKSSGPDKKTAKILASRDILQILKTTMLGR